MNRQMPSNDKYTEAPPDIAAELNAAVTIEDDFPSPEELRRELKRSVTIRLDPEVYAWFQLPGPGYQTRINSVLRHYVEQQKAHKASAQPTGLSSRSTFLGGKRAAEVAANKKKANKARRPAKKTKKARTAQT
jgi:uncharacterized protein (DUF4415 family)